MSPILAISSISSPYSHIFALHPLFSNTSVSQYSSVWIFAISYPTPIITPPLFPTLYPRFFTRLYCLLLHLLSLTPLLNPIPPTASYSPSVSYSSHCLLLCYCLLLHSLFLTPQVSYPPIVFYFSNCLLYSAILFYLTLCSLLPRPPPPTPYCLLLAYYCLLHPMSLTMVFSPI
jgi:hypothetical protein